MTNVPEPLEAADAETLAFYAKEAARYVAAGAPEENAALAAFMALLPKGGRVLELGCGGGKDAEAMLAQGFDVDPTDGTPEMVAAATIRLGRPARLMRFDQLTASSAYDGVWANASLLHAPLDALPSILTRIFKALKPGGFHAASYKGGGKAGRDRFGRYYNYPDRDQLMVAYEVSAPWNIVAVKESTGKGYDGVAGPWFAITARRPL